MGHSAVVRHYARWPSAAENLETFDVTKLGIFKINIIRSIDLNVRVALIKC